MVRNVGESTEGLSMQCEDVRLSAGVYKSGKIVAHVDWTMER